MNHDRNISSPVQKTCKVTVGIPVYNGGRYLKMAVDSVLRQTFSDFELIVTDDGSTDDSLQILQGINDTRIRIVTDGERRGLPARLNQQTQMAQGKYFIRMDADDVMFPNRIAEQVEYLDTHTNIDVVGAKAVIIDEQSEVIYQYRPGGKAPATRKDVINGRMFIHPSVAGRTAWFRANPYDESKCRSQDFFLWLESAEHSTFALMDKPLLFYRVLKKDVVSKFLRDNQLMRSFYWAEFKQEHSFANFFYWTKQLFRLSLFHILYACVGDAGVMKRRYQPIEPGKKAYFERVLAQMQYLTIN